MKKIRILCLYLLLLSVSAFGQVGPSGPSRVSPTKEIDAATFTASAQTVNFQDGLGTISNTFAVITNNAPSSLTLSIYGCMRGNGGGVCTTSPLASSSGTTSQILVTSGLFDFYRVVETWTGGSSLTTINVNRTGTTGGAAVEDIALNIPNPQLAYDGYANILGPFTLTSVDGAGNFTGTIPNGASNAYKGYVFNIGGFVNGANNPTGAVCTGSTATTLSFSTLTTVVETHAAIATGPSGNARQTQFKTLQPGKIARVSCSVDSGTVAINLDIRSESTPNSTGTLALGSGNDLVCGTSTATTTVIPNAAYLADSPIAVTISSFSGSPSVLRVHVATVQQ